LKSFQKKKIKIPENLSKILKSKKSFKKLKNSGKFKFFEQKRKPQNF
jgi:hypothetical protein